MEASLNLCAAFVQRPSSHVGSSEKWHLSKINDSDFSEPALHEVAGKKAAKRISTTLQEGELSN